jgi:chromosome segregation ATPase
MNSALKDLGQWREETDAHLARLDRVTQEHGEDLRAKRGADNKMLTAIRETQTEHGDKLDSIEVKLDNLSRGLRKADRDLESVSADMSMVKGRLGKVEDKLGSVSADMSVVKGRLGKVEDKLGSVSADMTMVKGRLGKVEDKLAVIAKTQDDQTRALAAVETRLDKMDERFDKMDERFDKMDEKLDLLLSR